MASRSPTLALLAFLAACATPSTGPPSDDPVYLEGVTSRYSVRLDELRPDSSHRHTQLPKAVVAGDEAVTVAASMFLHDDAYYTLDVLVHNHSEEPLVLDRENIQVRDNVGERLTPIEDFEGASLCGLRAKQGKEIAQGARPEVATGATNATGTERGENGNLPRKIATGDPSFSTDVGSTSDDLSWVSNVPMSVTAPNCPKSMQVPPGGSCTYWKYWKAKHVEFPLYATIHVDHKRLLLKFDTPLGGR